MKLTSPGPVIFKQERVGLNKELFTMYKFRSMVVNDQSNTAWSTNEDPRKTKFGAFIRKFSIDELPQLYNVLKGDMSLVGPRPELPYFVGELSKKRSALHGKAQVKPASLDWLRSKITGEILLSRNGLNGMCIILRTGVCF